MANTFGERLRELRHAAGIGQRELSKRSGLSLSHIQYLERDKKWPGDETLGKLARHLGVTKKQLIEERDRVKVDTALTVLLRENSSSLTDEDKHRLEAIARDLLKVTKTDR